MKKVWKKLTTTVALCVGFLCVGNLSIGDFSLCMTAYANEEEKIESGIYVDDINLAGMTVSEAKKAYRIMWILLQIRRLFYMRERDR